MSKCVIKNLIGICIVCVIGFSLGYFFECVFNDDAVASGNDYKEGETKDITEYHTDIFSEDIYVCTYNKEKRFYRYNKKKSNVKSVEDDTGYRKGDDTLSIAKQIFNNECDIVLKNSGGSSEIYEEYKDGYPTGGMIGFVYDEKGIMLEAYIREGSVYEFDEKSMITYEEAYRIGIEALYDKYGKNTVLYGTIDDCKYEIIYRPDLELMCYSIEVVEGYINGDAKGFVGEVSFYLNVSVDGTYTEIASTLGY